MTSCSFESVHTYLFFLFLKIVKMHGTDKSEIKDPPSAEIRCFEDYQAATFFIFQSVLVCMHLRV